MQPFQPYSLNLHGQLHVIEKPQVMGIINVTPDSFFDASRAFDRDSIARHTEQMISDGADMLDLGAYSSRPGAKDISVEEETERIIRGVETVRSIDKHIPVSVDTFRAKVAEAAINAGADIINDISGGDLDPDMMETVARLRTPYILMHMRGTPATMQTLTDYDNLVADIIRDLASKTQKFRQAGVADIIVDPGFGFSKTLEQNYELLSHLSTMITALECPVLIGVSRKSMITRALGITPDEALNGTTVINTLAMLQGASIIRVHDVKEAKQAVELTTRYNQFI